jgi:hypothetical protein
MPKRGSVQLGTGSSLIAPVSVPTPLWESRLGRLRGEICRIRHSRPMAAFETHSGRLLSSIAMPAHALYLPFAIAVGIGSVGWKHDVPDLAGYAQA